ncbi:hypothetical protein C8J57DRAFT_1517419 [Mycena rebaudengoi]|nr:hypothetical protein C8J57DRAFT_1517419 [Mycena rebaudengoi]
MSGPGLTPAGCGMVFGGATQSACVAMQVCVLGLASSVEVPSDAYLGFWLRNPEDSPTFEEYLAGWIAIYAQLDHPSPQLGPSFQTSAIHPSYYSHSHECIERLGSAARRPADGIGQPFASLDGQYYGDSDTLLVLKIIRPSVCHYPPPDKAWAYEALQEKQGLCVPYLFGLHTAINDGRPLTLSFSPAQIITPSGESAWVLVLEYIPGVTLDAVQSISDVQNACIAGLDTVREITCAGFALEDIRAPNFILTEQPDARAVVAIDFYGAQRTRPGVDIAKVAANDEIDFFSRLAACAHVHYPDIYQWAKE